jgi:hypothetical protein
MSLPSSRRPRPLPKICAEKATKAADSNDVSTIIFVFIPCTGDYSLLEGIVPIRFRRQRSSGRTCSSRNANFPWLLPRLIVTSRDWHAKCLLDNKKDPHENHVIRTSSLEEGIVLRVEMGFLGYVDRL